MFSSIGKGHSRQSNSSIASGRSSETPAAISDRLGGIFCRPQRYRILVIYDVWIIAGVCCDALGEADKDEPLQRKGDVYMIPVIRQEGEEIEHLIRRFKRAVNRDDIITEYRKRTSYKKPGDRRRAKHKAALKRRRES